MANKRSHKHFSHSRSRKTIFKLFIMRMAQGVLRTRMNTTTTTTATESANNLLLLKRGSDATPIHTEIMNTKWASVCANIRFTIDAIYSSQLTILSLLTFSNDLWTMCSCFHRSLVHFSLNTALFSFHFAVVHRWFLTTSSSDYAQKIPCPLMYVNNKIEIGV